MGVVVGLDDVAGGRGSILEVGLLEDNLGLPAERFSDGDGFPSFARQQAG